jgi:hypothetical protein
MPQLRVNEPILGLNISSHRSRRIYTWYRVSGTRELKPQSCAARTTISRDVISLQDQSRSLWRMHVRIFSHITDSDIGGQKGKSFIFVSGEVARRLRAVHLRRIGGKRSRDLTNSGVRRVRAQTLGTPSHEDARHEKEDDF